MSEIMKLNDKWEGFIEYVDDNEDMDSKGLKKYKDLMVETFKVLKEEWEHDTISKELCLFFATFGKFGVKGWDNEGNCLYDECYEIASLFHEFFITTTFKNKGFKFNDKGKLIVEGYDGSIFYINPDIFDFPTDLDELYGD